MQDRSNTPVSRREMLAGAAIGTAAIVAGSAIPAAELRGDHALKAMAHEVATLQKQSYHVSGNDAAIAEICDAQDRILVLISKTPAKTLMGVLQKIEALRITEGESLISDDPGGDALASIFADVERFTHS